MSYNMANRKRCIHEWTEKLRTAENIKEIVGEIGRRCRAQEKCPHDPNNFFANHIVKHNQPDYSTTSELFHGSVKIMEERLYGKRAKLYPLSITLEASFYVTAMLITKFQEQETNIRKIGLTLSKIKAVRLQDVVAFEIYNLTGGFYQYRHALSIKEYELQTALQIVTKSADFPHLQELISHTKMFDAAYLFEPLIDNLTELHKCKPRGRHFIKSIERLYVYSFDMYLWKLEEALINANLNTLKIFFKYRFRYIIKKNAEIDIEACLYANKKIVITSLFNEEDINVNARGTRARTALHFAAEYNVTENIQFLLDRKADVNVLDWYNESCLSRTCFKGFNRDPRKANAQCLKLLLMAGADPFLAATSPSFFGFDSADHFNSSSKCIMKVLTAQLAIHEALGESIETTLNCFYEYSKPMLKRYFERCRRLLQEMKTHEVRNSSEYSNADKFTMFAILTGNVDEIITKINQCDIYRIVRFMKGRKYKNATFYTEILSKRLRQIKKLFKCKWKLINILFQSSKKKIGINQNLVVNKIIDYLTTDEMMKIE